MKSQQNLQDVTKKTEKKIYGRTKGDRRNESDKATPWFGNNILFYHEVEKQ